MSSSPSPSPTPPRSYPSSTSPRKSLNGRMRPAPYMVALSGWPEPVYIDSGKLAALNLDDNAAIGGGRRGSQGSLRIGVGTSRGSVKADGTSSPQEGRSRSGTPTSCRPNVKGGSLGLGRVINQDIYPYLNTSPTPHNPQDPSSSHDVKSDAAEARPPSPLPLYPNNPSSIVKHPHPPPPASTSHIIPTGSSSRVQSRFADPRFTPRASVIGQRGAHLRVVPSWSNSSASTPDGKYSSIRTAESADVDMESTPPRPSLTDMPPPPLPAKVSSIGVGGRYLQLGLSQGKAKAAILRSTPEVYPPPSSGPDGSVGSGAVNCGMGIMAGFNSMPGLGGMATEVYPRDPESSVFWQNAKHGIGDGGRRGSGGGETPQKGGDAKEGMIVDD